MFYQLEFVKVLKFIFVLLYENFVKLKAKENERFNFYSNLFRSKLIFIMEIQTPKKLSSQVLLWKGNISNL